MRNLERDEESITCFDKAIESLWLVVYSGGSEDSEVTFGLPQGPLLRRVEV